MRRWLAPALIGIATFAWGAAVGSYHVFPYDLLRLVKRGVTGADANEADPPYRVNEGALRNAEADRALKTKAAVVMVGDSIVAGGRWPELFPDADVINRGVSGDTVEGVLQRVPTILSAEPRKIFIQVGLNDVASRNSNEEILTRYEALLNALTDGGRQIYVESVLLCRPMPDENCLPDMLPQIHALNASLSALAARKGAIFIDLNPKLADANGMLPTYSIDGVHLSGAGFAAVRNMLAPHMRDSQAVEAAR